MAATITNNENGKSTILTDNDLWGISCTLQHAIQTGYYNDNPDNLKWAESMKNIIDEMR